MEDESSNNDNDNSNSFMMEMSQDCIVWDESRNVDLREIAISPLENIGSGRKSSNRKKSGIDSNSNSKQLDSIKRRLNQSSSDTSSASRPEQEIDGIFKILEQQGTSPNPLTVQQTQATGNVFRQRAGLSVRRPQMATSLASRKRRRRREGSRPSIRNMISTDSTSTKPSIQSRRRRRVTDSGGAFNSPVPQSSKRASMSTDDITNDGAFEALLKEFSTPLSMDKNEATLPLENCDLERPVDVSGPSGVAMKQNVTEPTPSLHSQPKTSPTVDQSRNDLTSSSQSNPQTQQMKAASRTKLAVPPAVNRYQKILPPQPASAEENRATSKHKNHQPPKSASQGPPRSNLLQPSKRPPFSSNSNIQPSSKTTSSVKSTMPPPSIPATAATKSPTFVSSSNVDGDDDEFEDDFDFGDECMANLDNLLSMKSSTQAAAQPDQPPSNLQANQPYTLLQQSTKPAVSSSSHADDGQTAQPATSTLEKSIKPAVPSTTNNNDMDDEFDDFPDIDFAAMDEVIAQRNAHAPACTADNNGSTSWYPSHDTIIKNSRRVPTAPDVSFINFTRYKVVDVEVKGEGSHNFWLKTLTVASWTDEMRKEEEEEKNIHRNCQVTTSDDREQGLEQPLNNVASGCLKDYKPEGLLHLCDRWYHTAVNPGDIVHLCSVSGRFRTDVQALPVVLHTNPPNGSDKDDLVLVTHPDVLMTPTTISEALACPRRAVLKARVGSTGLTSKAPLFGILRHELFGLCMKQEKFDSSFAKRNVHKMVRQHAEGLLGCNVSTNEAQQEILKVLPVIQQFVADYTKLGKPPNPNSLANAMQIQGPGPEIQFVAHKVHAIEEPIISPELALKGNIDAVLEANTRELDVRNAGPRHSLMCLELKTGHSQNIQTAHAFQLALYTLMLQSRYGAQTAQSSRQAFAASDAEPDGASPGSLLLYLNQNGSAATHISPDLGDQKDLIGQRNHLADALHRSSRPRGVVLSYEDGSRSEERQTPRAKLLAPPPADLPSLIPNGHACSRCYVNRECMLYAAAENENPNNPNWAAGTTHGDLVAKFAGKLQDSDVSYFRKWDRLIDLEADASSRNIATAWLSNSHLREKEKGESVSCLLFDFPEPSPTEEGSHVLIAFRRGESSQTQTPLENIALSRGSHVIISTDGTSLDDSSQRPLKKFRHQMHISRGFVEKVEAGKLFVLARREELERMRDLLHRYKAFCTRHHPDQHSQLLFRLDKDTSSVGIGTLRQNLINLLTADCTIKKDEQLSQASASKISRLPKLRDVVVRLVSPQFNTRITPDSLFKVPGPHVPGCAMESLSAEFARLNPDQQKAVVKVISACNYTLLQGLPGTGKSTTLAFIARLLAARGKRVLITSYTHAAVDNVVLKLIEKGVSSVNESHPVPALIRIGQKSSCHSGVRFLLASEIALQLDKNDGSAANMHTLSQTESYHNFDNPSVESLKKVASSARIVCASALSVPKSPLLVHEAFDVVIIDEAGQISQPAILGALVAADSFVLVGDHKQLPPLVNSELAQAGGYGVSMMERLAKEHPNAITSLTYQYRMNMEICRLSSESVYGGQMKCGNDAVSNRTLQLTEFPSLLPPARSKIGFPWLRSVIDPKKGVVFVDTDNVKTVPQTAHTQKPSIEPGVPKEMEALEGHVGGRAGRNVVNRAEVSLVRIILSGLFACGVCPKSVGVISPFRAQLRILEDDPKIISWKEDGLELSTIDRYQGRDKEVIILCTVRSNPAGKVGRLLLDMRRLNVALTRAKSKLIIVGSFSTLSTGSSPLRPLLARVNKRGQRFLLPEDAVQCYPNL